MSMPNTALVIGGTGVQGADIVKALISTDWTVSVTTRNVSSPGAVAIASSPKVKLLQGDATDEAFLVKSLPNHSTVFVNLNGFAIGEKAEVYWGIRIYELAFQAGVKHFIWCSVDYGSKLGNFEAKYRCGHLDGKGKVAEWLSSQPSDKMKWSVLGSGPYMNMLSEYLAPKFDEANDQWVFALPLGDGEIPVIVLEDLGYYAAWLANNPDESSGFWLKTGTVQAKGVDFAEALAKVTGKKATYKPVSIDEYFSAAGFRNADAVLGYGTTLHDSTFMTWRQNFTGFWNVWSAGLGKRDYALMDKIHPKRVRSVEEWMRKTGFTGESGSVLKGSRRSRVDA